MVRHCVMLCHQSVLIAICPRYYPYPQSVIIVNILGSQKCALPLNVPILMWFKSGLMMTL
jgi:hypothetical protein